jgi:hypothetical protein
VYVVPISAADVGFGKKLWNALRVDKTFPAKGMLWLFDSKTNEWRLLIASPRVDVIGPRKAYEELLRITNGLVLDSEQLQRIALISPSLPLYQALRSVFGKTESVEGARLGNTQVGGMYIDDAYLYEIR